MAENNRKTIKYNEYNDIRFPVALLFRAYDILNEKGHGVFRAYCQRVSMPSQDVERVLNKYNYQKDPEFKKTINQKFETIARIFTKGESDLTVPF